MKRNLCILLLSLLCAGNLRAQIPRTISYQGSVRTLKDSIPEGFQLVYFALYSSPTATKSLYLETQRVNVVNGIFSAEIGSVTSIPDSLMFDKPYWLGIAFESHTELSPRIPLSSVPYALHAKTADGLSPDFQLPAKPIGVPVPISGAARGDFAGYYPSPVVASLGSDFLLAKKPNKGDMLWWNGGTWTPRPTPRTYFFQVVIKAGIDSLGNVILSNSEVIYNIGNALHPELNAFIVPESGFYHFDASGALGQGGQSTSALSISVNNKTIYDRQYNVDQYHTTLMLSAGMVVKLNGRDAFTFSGFKIN